MDNVNKNRVNNLILQYGTKNNKENFKKLESVIQKRDFFIYNKFWN